MFLLSTTRWNSFLTGNHITVYNLSNNKEHWGLDKKNQTKIKYLI